MNIVFRTDASLEIGSGHVMRCLTLAATLRDRGANCRFICREHPGNMLAQIRQYGFDTIALPAAKVAYEKRDGDTTHAAWLGVDWEEDAGQALDVLGNDGVEWLIVDHYALDARWERAMRKGCARLMAIDDLADREHDCDLLLDQNLGRENSDYLNLVPARCRLLTGPLFALLRPDFSALRPYSLDRRSNPQFKKLLIAFGGVDQLNATGEVLEALKHCSLPADIEIMVVMGAHAPYRDRVRELAATMPCSTEVRVEVRDMATIMAECDFAIGAAGSTSWERCCLGLPSILIVMAENQAKIALELQKAEAAIALDFDSLAGELCKVLEKAHTHHDMMTSLVSASSALVDGLGLERVFSELSSSREAL